MLTTLIVLAALVVALVIAGAALLVLRREARAKAQLAQAEAAGLNQPASLHPVIDPDICIGSSACIEACPEKVLGRVDGSTYMLQAGSCLGHGRCHASCPVGAISLVFGTAERGLDIPLLRAGYESNVDGVFIVGELGGMGLIRNAMRQGMKAVASVAKVLAREGVVPAGGPDVKDVVIVGGGPAGIATAVKCVETGLSYTLLEQDTVGGSVTKYPRRKMVFTEVIKLPLVGRFGKSEMLKEELVAEFERVIASAGVELLEGRRVSGIEGCLGDFRVQVQRQGAGTEVHRGRTVILAIGRRGTPRRLEVPGEELPHVVYSMIDAEQYRHRKVLCVGGGDSAVEAAVALAGVAGCEVHLSYRGRGFFRVKQKNREQLEAAVADGRVQLHLETEVERIVVDRVVLRGPGDQRKSYFIDDVIVNVGGLMPTPFLESLGVVIETKHGEVAVESPAESARRARMASRRMSRRLSGRRDAP